MNFATTCLPLENLIKRSWSGNLYNARCTIIPTSTFIFLMLLNILLDLLHGEKCKTNIANNFAILILDIMDIGWIMDIHIMNDHYFPKCKLVLFQFLTE